MFLDYDQECWKVQLKVIREPVNILVCDHEEADTCLLLHVKHAAKYRNQGINLVSDDTLWFLVPPTVIKLVPIRYINLFYDKVWYMSFCLI